MFDQHMILEDSFQNEVENGQTTGFRFLARLPYYRGLGLSMVEDVKVVVDGEEMPRSAISLGLRGRTWTLDQLETEYGDRWNFGEKASVIVKMPGGLAKGAHEVELAETLRISYLPFVPTTKCKKSITFAG